MEVLLKQTMEVKMEEININELNEKYEKYSRARLIKRLILMDKILTNLSKIAENKDIIGFMVVMNEFVKIKQDEE